MRAWAKLRKTVASGRRLGALLSPHARGERGAVAGILLLGLLVLAFRMAQPWPLKWIFDALGGPDGGRLALLCAAFLGLSLAAALAEWAQQVAVVGFVNRIVYAFRRALFGHVLRLPLAFHEKRDTGELLTRVVPDVARVRRGVIGLFLRGFRSALLFLATAGVLLWIDRPLGAVVLACGVAAGLSMLFSGRRIVKAARKSRAREGRLAGVVEEDLQAVRDLQTYRPDGEPDARFDAWNDRSLRSEQKLRRLEAGLLLRVELLLTGALFLIIWLGTARLGPGGLVLFISYVLNLYRPFAQFARQTSQTGRTLACGERLVRIMEREAEPAERPGAAPAPPFEGAVAFEDVSVRAPRRRRGGRRKVLRDVSFSVGPGERVAVLGPNGAGKSTLLRQIVRLSDPRAGRIRVDGRDVREYTLASLRAQVSVVYPDAAFPGLSVRENVALGRPAASDGEVREAAERAGLAGFVEGLPRGYDTRVRKRGTLFSSGERQRLALARAILRDGRLWLLDEPTAGLDAEAEARLEEALLRATRGRTTLWATHDTELAGRLDRVLFLAAGRVRFFGTPGEFALWARCAGEEEPFLRELAGRMTCVP